MSSSPGNLPWKTSAYFYTTLGNIAAMALASSSRRWQSKLPRLSSLGGQSVTLELETSALWRDEGHAVRTTIDHGQGACFPVHFRDDAQHHNIEYEEVRCMLVSGNHRGTSIARVTKRYVAPGLV